MASPSVTYTFTAGTTAAAAQVNQNFTDVINALTNGALDLTANSLSLTSTLSVLGNATFGNSAPNDTVTFTSRIASVFVPSVTNTYDLGTSALLWKDIYLAGNALVGGYVEIPLGSKASPTIRGTTTSADSGIYFKAADEPCITAGGVDVFRWRSDGQIDCGVGAEDDDHNTGTSTSDFNYRGQTIRCVSATATGVTIAALNRSTAGAGADAVLKAEVEATGGDPYIFLSVGGTGMSIGLDNSDSDALIFADGTGLPNTIRAKLDGSTRSWQFGTDTNTTMTHKFIGASVRMEADVSGGPAIQIRSLRTAVGAGEALGAFQFYTSDSGSAGVQADIRAVETGGSGVNYYLSFRAGASGSLTEGLRIIETGRARFVDGTTALPGISAISDTDTGIQFGGSNDMYLVAGGAVKLQLLAASVRFGQPLWSTVSGSFSAPDIAHGSDTDTGIVFGQSNDVYFTAGTAQRFVANATGVAFNGATAIARPDYTVTNPSTLRSIDVSSAAIATVRQVLGTLIEDLISYGLLQ